MRERIENWLASKDISAGKIACIAAGALAAAVLAGYMVLCVWVQRSDQLLPGTVIADGRGETVVELGKLTREAALHVVTDAMNRQLGSHGFTLIYGEDQQVKLSDSLIANSSEAAVNLGFASKKRQPNWKLGLLWLGVIHEPVELSLLSSTLAPEAESQVKKLIASIAEEVYVAPVDFTYELEAESVVVTPGVDGLAVDPEALLDAIKDALSQGKTELRVEPAPVSGKELSGKALHDFIQTEPQSASVDADGRLIPAVIGLSVDAEEAQAVLDASAPGEPCVIPLRVTPAPPAADDSMFYKDLLAQYISDLDGDAAWISNATQAASACDGKVIQPGERFSFLEATGETNAGSGIEQAASSLYYCAVYANLSIAERTNGTFLPSSIPAGLDAAVNGPDQDLAFRNSTGFPIKIAATVSGSQLTVQFYGSNPDGVRVEVQCETKSSSGWTTVYQPSSSVRRGSTIESTSPSDGCVVEVYRCVYEGGNLLSCKLENTSTYEKQDQVILYNPADSGPWGAGASTQTTTRPAARPNTNSRPSNSASRPNSTPSSTPAAAPDPPPSDPEPTGRVPDSTIPDWLNPGTPGTSVEVPSTTPGTPDRAPDSTMPDWLQ